MEVLVNQWQYARNTDSGAGNVHFVTFSCSLIWSFERKHFNNFIILNQNCREVERITVMRKIKIVWVAHRNASCNIPWRTNLYRNTLLGTTRIMAGVYTSNTSVLSTVQQAPLQKTFQKELPFAGALPGQPPLEETHRSGVWGVAYGKTNTGKEAKRFFFSLSCSEVWQDLHAQ